MFEDSLLIVAHPDDDILWMGSVIDKVDAVIFCFNDDPGNPSVGKARQRTIKEYPLSNVSTLDLNETQSWDKADWTHPDASAYGIKIVKSLESESRYQEAYEELLKVLRSRVAEAKNVFTHNPWGEYGHEEHVLVYRVLKALQTEFHFDVWFSNYCSNRSVNFMNHFISGFDVVYESLPVNLPLVNEIAEIYRKNECWTWYEDYRWFESECLIREKPGVLQTEALPYGRSFPLNYIKIHVDSNPPGPDRFTQAISKLKRKLHI